MSNYTNSEEPKDSRLASEGQGRPSGVAEDSDRAHISATHNTPEGSRRSGGSPSARDQVVDDRANGPSLVLALDQLQNAARMIIDRGQPTVAAAVSLEMRKNGYIPSELGFPRFRDFLAVAEKLGIVSLTRTKDAADVVILPVASGEPRERLVRNKRTNERLVLPTVDRELWQAFVDWDPAVYRTFDKKLNRVVSRRHHPISSQQVHSSYEVPIKPISRSTQLAWMEQFIRDGKAGDLKDALSSALEDSRPLARFIEVVRSSESIRARWREYFQNRVLSEINNWTEENSLHVEMFYTKKGRKRAVDPIPLEGALNEKNDATGGHDELKQAILDVLSQLPLHELLKISIPIGYVVNSEHVRRQ